MNKQLNDEQKKVIGNVYYTDGLKVGIQKLYHALRDNYPEAKITRSQVSEWLKLQTDYQINQAQKTVRHIKTIQANKKHELIQIDLIDYSQNTAPNANKYILSIVDVFTRHAWVFALKRKTAAEVKRGFEKFLQDLDESEFPLKRVMNDDGGEFQGEFADLLKSKGIVQSSSNRSQAQGIVERFNKSIKTLIERYVQENPNVNKFTAMDKVLPLYNDTYHTTIKMTPNQAYNLTEDETGELKNLHKARVRKNKEKVTNSGVKVSNQNNEIEVGDVVRVAISKKGDLTKKFVNNWTEDTYKVIRVIKARKVPNTTRYQLENYKGEKITRTYYREELQKIKEDLK